MTTTATLLRNVEADLARAGLRASILVRHLGTGDEVGMGGDDPWPLASLAKVPLALSVLAAVRAGRVDPGQRLSLTPGHGSVPAAVGAGQLEHVASVALVDAVYLAVSLSDTVAADALLDVVPWTEATALLRELGLRDTFLRSRFAELTQTPAEQMIDTPELAHVVASSAALDSGGHRLAALDLSRTSTSTPRDLATLLGAVWDPRNTPLHPDDARHLRRLLRANVHRQRLWQELASPSSVWASKTGTLLNLRHEAGVAEHGDGDRLAVVALTASSTPAVTQPYAEFVMAQAARRVHDHVRG